MKHRMPELLAVIGVGCVIYGAGSIYPPAAWIVGGMAFCIIAKLGAD